MPSSYRPPIESAASKDSDAGTTVVNASVRQRGAMPQKVSSMSQSNNSFQAIRTISNGDGIRERLETMAFLLSRFYNEQVEEGDLVCALQICEVRELLKTTQHEYAALLSGILDGSAIKDRVSSDIVLDALAAACVTAPATIDLAALAQHISVSDIAKHISVSDIAETFSASDIAEEIDVEDIARHMDCEDIASHVDVSSIKDDIVNDLDMSDLASHIDAQDIARYIDCSDVAAQIDMQDLAKDIARNIDHDDLAAEIVLQDLAKEIDIDRLASNIDLAKLSAALLKALSIVPSVMTLKVGETVPAFVND